MKTLITFNIFFGAVVLLVFVWRRLTAPAILISLAIWVLLIGILPPLVPAIAALRQHPSLVTRTEPRRVVKGESLDRVFDFELAGSGPVVRSDRP